MAEFEIKQLLTGANWVSHKRAANVPQTFKRPTAALAHLIDYATAIGATVTSERDEEHPDCYDVLVITDNGADQFTIEPVGFKLNS